MQYLFHTTMSSIVFIIILSLANNLCFVAVAKFRKWRLDRKNTVSQQKNEIWNLLKENQQLREEITAIKADNSEPEKSDESKVLVHQIIDNTIQFTPKIVY